jgi:hypothetical protein
MATVLELIDAEINALTQRLTLKIECRDRLVDDKSPSDSMSAKSCYQHLRTTWADC